LNGETPYDSAALASKKDVDVGGGEEVLEILDDDDIRLAVTSTGDKEDSSSTKEMRQDASSGL